MSLPYQEATSGARARDEIVKILKRFGCESVGFMDEFATHELLLAFRWRGRNVQLRASAQGWANAWLQENPWNTRRTLSEDAYQRKALLQGMVAVNSILRDWVKGQVTAIETGILTFEEVFMPYVMLPDGSRLIEHATKLLPPPEASDDR